MEADDGLRHAQSRATAVHIRMREGDRAFNAIMHNNAVPTLFSSFLRVYSVTYNNTIVEKKHCTKQKLMHL